MRILLPNALISSPLGLFKNTREDAILYGANVIMYNICNHSNIIKQNKKKKKKRKELKRGGGERKEKRGKISFLAIDFFPIPFEKAKDRIKSQPTFYSVPYVGF